MAKIKKPQPKIDPHQLQLQLADINAKYVRALADYQNLEKRTQEQQAHFVKLANATLVTKLISILDNLEMAATHLKDPGLNLVLSEFKSTLELEGVTAINPQGEEFNPDHMECVEILEGPDNQVVKVATKGYKLNDILIRPAKVHVGKSTSAQTSA